LMTDPTLPSARRFAPTPRGPCNGRIGELGFLAYPRFGDGERGNGFTKAARAGGNRATACSSPDLT
jgi:hypothetical protein